MEEVRLQKFLADCGIASRRKCEEFIIQGKVKVNGNIAELGQKVKPDIDEVYFNNKLVKLDKEEKVYILLNKPIGIVTTAKDQFNRESVLDIIKIDKRIVPAGRLDMYTSGALILSNDGDFIYKITHPKNEINKTYVATVIGKVSNEEIESLRQGVDIGDYITRQAKVRILKYDIEKNVTRIEIVIHEGKNRQVRKMCDVINKKVVALHRSKISSIDVKDLKIGEWRYLKKEEINKLT